MIGFGYGENVHQEHQTASSQSKYALELGEEAAAFSSGEYLTFNSHRGGGRNY